MSSSMETIKKHGVFETQYLKADIVSHDLLRTYIPTCKLCAVNVGKYKGFKLPRSKYEALRDACLEFDCFSYDKVSETRKFFLDNIEFKDISYR